MQRIQKKDREERPDESAGVIANAFKSKRFPPHLFVYRRCDERIAWSRPGPRAYSVQQPCTKDALPSRRNTHQRLGYCRREITSQRYTFLFLQPVGKCAGEACTIFCAAWAKPSTSPTILPLALNVRVRNTGNTG